MEDGSMKKFQTITGENISIKKGLEIKAELETMVNDINEGKVNRKQLKELCSEFVKKQNKAYINISPIDLKSLTIIFLFLILYSSSLCHL